MNNLKQLYELMEAAGVTSNIFPVDYNGHRVTCILIIQDYGCSLIISTLGAEPETIAIDIPASFNAPTQLDTKEYHILARYLGFTGATGNIFFPLIFSKNLTPILCRALIDKPPSKSKPEQSEELLILQKKINVSFAAGDKMVKPEM